MRTIDRSHAGLIERFGIRASVAIMTVPERLGTFVPSMIDALDCPYTLVIDTDHGGIWETFKVASLDAAHPRATHQIVLQDDLWLCKNLISTLLYLARLRPEAAIQPYTARKCLLDAHAQRSSWLIDDGTYSYASIRPLEQLRAIIDWADRMFLPAYKWDDRRVNFWHFWTNAPHYVTVPSLIQHLGWNQSTVGNPSMHTRESLLVIAPEDDPMRRDWKAGLHDPPRYRSGLSEFKANYQRWKTSTAPDWEEFVRHCKEVRNGSTPESR